MLIEHKMVYLGMFWKRIAIYLNPATMFRKQKDGEKNTNLFIMHSINRISIFMFLFCVIVLLIRYLR